jgi:uncharacterized protein (TIGR02001 family)
MVNHTLRIAIAAALLGSSMAAVAAEDAAYTLTGNLSFTSDYRFRGISQTSEGPAIQGGFDYAHKSGFYLGTWGSNIDFGGSMEIDVYGGYNFAVNDDFSINVGGIYYAYPSDGGAPDLDTFEVYGGGTWKWLNGKLSYSTTDFFGLANSDGSYYAEANATFPLPMDLSLGLHYGYQLIEGVPAGIDDDIQDWKISLSTTVMGFGVSLAYVDSDLDNVDIADGTAVFTIGKTF